MHTIVDSSRRLLSRSLKHIYWHTTPSLAHQLSYFSKDTTQHNSGYLQIAAARMHALAGLTPLPFGDKSALPIANGRNTIPHLLAGADAVMQKDESRERLLQLIGEARGHIPAITDVAGEEAPVLVPEAEAIWGTIFDREQRDAILFEFRQGSRRTLDDLQMLLDNKDVGALPDELHFLLGQCRTVGAFRMQRFVGECKSAFDYAKLIRLEQLLAETFEAMDERCGEPHESTQAQRVHAVDVAERLRIHILPAELECPGSGKARLALQLSTGEPLDSPQESPWGGAHGIERGIEVLPLVNLERARSAHHLVEKNCIECEKLLEELHQALWACSEHCQLLLNSLCGAYDQIGAIRIARLAVDFEAHHAEFGPLQLEKLKSLHQETLTALSALSTPPSPQAVRRAADTGVHSAVTPVAVPTRGGLFVAAIDDSTFAHAVYDRVLFPALGADMQRSRAIGKTEREQLGFMDFALGRVDASLKPLPTPHRQADVALLDENIALNNEPHLLGSQLVQKLRGMGFVGVTCIVTGVSNACTGDLAALPGVDFVSPKVFNCSVLVAKLLTIHARRSGHSSTSEAARASTLINLRHFDGLDSAAFRPLLKLAYDNSTLPLEEGSPTKYSSPDTSLFTKMAQLEVRFHKDEDLAMVVHNLKGAAQTAGAFELAKQLRVFEDAAEARTVEGIAMLWSVLEATRRDMQAQGYIA